MESVKPRVRIGAGATINAGDYQSLKFDVSIEDSPREGETVAQACDRVSKLVDQKLEEKVVAAQEEIARHDSQN